MHANGIKKSVTYGTVPRPLPQTPACAEWIAAAVMVQLRIVKVSDQFELGPIEEQTEERKS